MMRSLRARLAVGAAMIGLIAVLASGLTVRGMTQMSAQVQVAVTTEKRIARFSGLASQISSLIVVLYEVAQRGVTADLREARLEGLKDNIRRNFAEIRKELDADVGAADQSDLDEQSRRATQSIGIARMEALFETTLEQFETAVEETPPNQRAARLQGQINAFSMGFDPLLNSAITYERRTREAAIARVAELRDSLTQAAFAVALLAIFLVSGFYFFLVRPQLSRLDQLRNASAEIGRENFAVALPDAQRDEIGQLFAATNQMAASLADRRAAVNREWDRLNQTIAERTEALRTANQALSQRDEDRRRFFADVSHELRTPLTVILMESELALKSGAAADSPLGIIHERARRLNQRIDDLLRIARSEAGKLTLEDTAFALDAAALAAVSDMRSLGQNAGVAIETAFAADTMVQGDPNWTRQVITGLIENALRHAAKGGLIRLTVDTTDDTARVHVVDNGPGIAASELPRMTERFAQAANGATKSEGFGIGLSLANWVMTQQGGQLNIESPTPEPFRLGAATGTKVTLSLPLAQV
ncbi:sensor histidine kinase [Yoonia sediminilitoris]|uniref:histidine kinase n=1 Tax=Yoonia sediminilitoris TaxID=1286148 RepID=A0A2T6KHF5_9RHOB|nr:HAMP domain-containing sensor histidine kinase [Yoonia sediminilitoris]PUB14933.1 hypothetical protein C8N45_105156 [Yoonia sediminilitoris]RCW95649.1 hypothetical protein DFP92_105155 [Yoonia sediminilitoris]